MPGTLIFRKLIIEEFVMRSRAFVFFALMVLVAGCATGQIKDTINHLSFSHDGKKVFFDRCREEVCQIQMYDLETGELSAYQSPPNERWTMVRQSYDGRKIVLSVIPMGEEYLDLSNMQIVVMDQDGKNVKKITQGPGAKIYPTFSHSGKKVLYAKAGYIRKKGGTPAAQFDAWEVDVETGKEIRLTFFKFFEMSHLAYFPDDERFIFYGFGAEAFPGVRYRDRDAQSKKAQELFEKNMSFGGIQVMHGREMLPLIFSPKDVHALKQGLSRDGKRTTFSVNAEKPMLSKDGTRLVFKGRGGKFYLYSPEGKHKEITNVGSINSAAISPDGAFLGEGYDSGIQITRIQDGRRLVELYLSRSVLIENWDNYRRQNPQIEYKMIPEVPSRIINSLT